MARPTGWPLASRGGCRRATRSSVRTQLLVVTFVVVDDFENLLLPTRAKWRRDEALDIQSVCIKQEMHHGLEVVRVCPANVCGHNHAVPEFVCAAMGPAVVTTNRAISRVIRLALILDVLCVCLVDGNRCENNETFNHHLPER
jgi:hypothetical protein